VKGAIVNLSYIGRLDGFGLQVNFVIYIANLKATTCIGDAFSAPLC